MKAFLNKILKFVFPARCVGCRAECSSICPKCLSKVPRAEKMGEDWITSVWSYKDRNIKKLLWQFKFEGKWSFVEDLGQVLYDHLSDELAEKSLFENVVSPILVPIPITGKKLRERGYNQSEILGKELVRRSGGFLACMPNVLQKIKETPTQHSIMNRSARLKNLRGTFAVKNPKEISGRDIVIIDDITTTHATLIEARRALREAGAGKILAFTIAH